MSGQRAALPLLALLVSAAAAGCDEKKSAPTSDGGADGATTSRAATSTIPGKPGCHPTIAGGALIASELEPGSVTIAAAHGKALVVNTLYRDNKASAERVVVSGAGTPEGKPEPVGSGALTWAAATRFAGELTTARFGSERDCKSGAIALEGAGAPRLMTPNYCRLGSMFAAAAHGELAIAATDGAAPGEPTGSDAPAVTDAVVFAGGKSSVVRLETFPPPKGDVLGAKIDSLAVAVGTTTAAVAYRIVRGATTELHVVKLSAAGAKLGKVEVVDRASVGAPALAFEGDTLHVIWPSRASNKEPFALRWTKWADGAAPMPTQKLGTGIITASAPSLAIEQSHFVLGWTDGERPGVVRIGASVRGILGAVELANIVSTPGVDAHDPKVAIDKGVMFAVWQELGSPKQELRASAITCLE